MKLDDNERKVDFLIDLYLLADKLIDPVTANVVIDELISSTSKQPQLPGHPAISRVYSSTAAGNPLRNLLLDLLLHEAYWSAHKDAGALGYPYEFLQDFMIEICRLTKGRPLRQSLRVSVVDQDRSRYYQKVEEASGS